MKNIQKQIPLLLAVLLVVALIPAQAVQAAFPGQNGKLAYGMFDGNFETNTFTGGIGDINLDGTGQRSLQTGTWHGNGDASTRAPRYSADGSKITYTYEQDSYELDIYTINADGTNPHNVTNMDFDDGRFAMYSSFHPNGNRLVYGELWYETNDWYGEIFTINEDGTNKQQLTATNPNQCNVYPVFSPDGSKIAFYRGDRVSGTGGIWVMNADGTNQQEVVQVVAESGCWFNSIGVGAVGDAGLVSSFDWSPDGSSLVYVRYTTSNGEETLTSSLRTVDLEGNEHVVYQTTSEWNDEYDQAEGSMLASAQYTPDGRIVLKDMNAFIDETATDNLRITGSIRIINTDGTGLQTIMSESGEGAMATYNVMYDSLLPTIQPLPNAATLQNPETGSSISLTTPIGTELTCSTTLKESAATTQDNSYNYPLGLVDFCFDTETTNNQVTLTFITALTPAQVTARKYNPITASYTDVPGATITETTLNNQHALQLTYTIADNGPLDLDPVTGQIKDPVGLAIVAGQSGGGLAATGESVVPLLMAALTSMSVGIVTLKRRRA